MSVRDLADGMAELSVILPATVAYAIRDRLRRQAAAIRTAASDAPAHHEGPGREAPQSRGTDAAGSRSGSEAAGSDASSCADPGFETPDTTTSHADTPVIDTRTLAQIGADICADLLLTAAPTIDPTTESTCPGGLGTIRGHVQITVPVLTLLGHTDAGAALDGQTPIDPQTARRLAADAPGWDRVLCHPVSGTVLDVDRYAPTTAQRRFLAARDRHCRAPGCRAPAARCQIDHNHEAHDGGPTHVRNLCHFCVRHHTVKTETEWTVTQAPDGTLHFRSPLGQKHSEKLPPRIVFTPDSASPPF